MPPIWNKFIGYLQCLPNQEPTTRVVLTKHVFKINFRLPFIHSEQFQPGNSPVVKDLSYVCADNACSAGKPNDQG